MSTATQPNETRTPADAIVDNWINVFGQMCYAQDQGEKMLRSFLDLGHTTREESKELVTRLGAQIRKNQEEMQRFVQASVQMSLAAFRPATASQYEDLTRKVDELSRKIEAISKK
jgi:polyhydroxyalkanoate synthesis regulator phasin